MTTKEFEKYLVGIGGLENGHFPDRPAIVTNICECDDGWLQMIVDLIEELIAAGWDKQICQIKEKFGGLRFYINSASDEVHDIIRKYEGKSYETCEVCGETGKLRLDCGWKGSRWYKTMCDKHYDELKAERK